MDFDKLNDIEDFLSELLSKKEEQVSNERISTKVEEEHIRFKREDLVTMLQLSSSIFNLRSTQVVPKSITIVCDNGSYKMIANNDLEYLDYEFEVLNKENQLTDTICLPINLIKSVTGVLDEEILIYKRSGNYYIRLLLEGDLYLELPTPEATLLTRPSKEIRPIYFKKEAGEDSCTVSGKHLLDALRAIMPIVEDEPQLERRRITFTKDRVYFNSRKYFMEYMLPLPSFRISLRFAEVLKKISLAYNTIRGIDFYEDVEAPYRIVVRCGNVFFTSTVTRATNEEKIVNYLERVRSYKQYSFKVEDLRRVVSIACSLPYSNKEVKLTYQDGLLVSIPMKDKTTDFKLDCSVIGDVKSKNTVIISAIDLKKLLDGFGSGDAILSILDSCVIIAKNNLIGVLGI